MSRFIDRLEKNIEKIDKRIENEEARIAKLQEKLDAHKITRAEFNLKRKHIDAKIHAMNARKRILQGGIVHEKHHIEEKKEEKEKKKEKKKKGKKE